MKHFVYLTTNLINNKQYIGDHSTHDINDEYIGSGIYLQRAIRKYGKENFERQILEFFDTKESSFANQEKYIIFYNTLIPCGYNISAKGGYGIPGSFLNDETKRKIGDSNKIALLGNIVSAVAKDKISKKLKGRILSNETKEKISISSKKPKSEEHAQKCRTVNLGRKHSEETIEKRRASNKKWHEEVGYSEETIEKMKNRIHTIEENLKISEKLKGHIVSEETRKKISEKIKLRNEERRNGKIQ